MIGVALLGAGSIGAVHAQNLANHPTFDLRWVSDLDIDRAERLCTSYGAVATGSPEQAVAAENTDAVVIASATAAHKDHVLLAAKHGKAVLCEKPVAMSLHDAAACIQAAADAGVVAAMGFNRRLDSAYGALQRSVADGEIGPVEMMRLVSRSDTPPAPQSAAHSGGMIREKGAHFFDLACWIAASDPVEIQALGGCLIDPAYADYDDVDTAMLTLRLENGALVGFDFGRRTTYGCDEMIEVFGSGGLLNADRQPVTGITRLAGERRTSPGLDESWRSRFADTYVRELDSFAAAIKDGAPVHATLMDGLRAQAVAEAARQAIASGGTVEIPAIWRNR